jgi:organic radical activating enzyme
VKGYISEGFVSIQGEGELAGKPQFFLRFAGCSMRCKFCDTKYAWKREDGFLIILPNGKKRLKNPVNPLELANFLNSKKGEIPVSISITGGEPLEQMEFLEIFLKNLKNFEILLETNGLHPEIKDEVINLIDIFSVDIKLPSFAGKVIDYSIHEAFLKKLKKFGAKGYIKIVFTKKTEKEEIRRALKLLEDCGISWNVYLQPTSPFLLKKGLKFIREELYPLHLRILPQIHKILNLR